MSKTPLIRILKALRNSIFSRPCLQVLVLYALICLAEGRPKTLKKCGRSESPMGRIIGGKYAQPGEYPWQVSLQLKKRFIFQHYCGGSILNEHYIVTAAHCIDYPNEPWMYEIITGVHQLSKKSRKPAKKYKVTEVIVHERYSDTTYPYDIALVRTKEPIQFEDEYVNGICLPESNEDPTGWAIVTGWGDTEENGYEPSDVLQAVKVPLVSRKECFAAYDEGREDDIYDIVDSQICAGIVVRDSCQGDSGGPLVQRNKRGIYTLIGIVSFGTGCGRKQYPGVYTKVASFMDWLEENMN